MQHHERFVARLIPGADLERGHLAAQSCGRAYPSLRGLNHGAEVVVNSL